MINSAMLHESSHMFKVLSGTMLPEPIVAIGPVPIMNSQHHKTPPEITLGMTATLVLPEFAPTVPDTFTPVPSMTTTSRTFRPPVSTNRDRMPVPPKRSTSTTTEFATTSTETPILTYIIITSISSSENLTISTKPPSSILTSSDIQSIATGEDRDPTTLYPTAPTLISSTSTTTVSTSTSPSRETGPSSENGTGARDEGVSKSAAATIVVVVLGCMAVSIAIFATFYCYRRRRASKREQLEKGLPPENPLPLRGGWSLGSDGDPKGPLKRISRTESGWFNFNFGEKFRTRGGRDTMSFHDIGDSQLEVAKLKSIPVRRIRSSQLFSPDAASGANESYPPTGNGKPKNMTEARTTNPPRVTPPLPSLPQQPSPFIPSPCTNFSPACPTTGSAELQNQGIMRKLTLDAKRPPRSTKPPPPDKARSGLPNRTSNQGRSLADQNRKVSISSSTWPPRHPRYTKSGTSNSRTISDSMPAISRQLRVNPEIDYPTQSSSYYDEDYTDARPSPQVTITDTSPANTSKADLWAKATEAKRRQADSIENLGQEIYRMFPSIYYHDKSQVTYLSPDDLRTSSLGERDQDRGQSMLSDIIDPYYYLEPSHQDSNSNDCLAPRGDSDRGLGERQACSTVTLTVGFRPEE